MATQLQTRVPEGGTTIARRALAPDLARGFMLLAIAFAHAPLFVTNIDRGSAILNDLTAFFHMLFVNNHARPMFAFLFGYALVQLMNRQLARGSDRISVRKLLRRRGWWLVVFGLVHVVVLVPIDILATYGLAAVLLVGLLRVRDSILLWVAGISLIPATLAVALPMWLALSNDRSTFSGGTVAAGGRGPIDLLVERVTSVPFTLVFGVLLVVPGVVFGIWAARRRVLDDPEQHRTFLFRATLITTAISLAGSIPAALVQTGAWADPSGGILLVVTTVQPLTGYFGGIGLAGIVALAAIRLTASAKPGRLTLAVQAVGQRSMSLYLLQSVVFVALFYPAYGLGLQDDLGLAGATGVAIATWLLSVLLAELMRRAGYRGPTEILLRRLAYRDRRTVAK